MSATVVVKEANGSGPTLTTISGFRFCNADNYNPGLDTPCVIDPGGVGHLTYSFWKHIFLDLSGSYTRINNVRFYSDGAIGWGLGTSGKVVVGKRDSGDNGIPVASYQQAAGNAASGYAIDDGTNGHAYYNGQTTPTVAVDTLTEGAPLLVDSNDHDGTAEQTKGVVLQLVIDGDASHGLMSEETFYWKWDEI